MNMIHFIMLFELYIFQLIINDRQIIIYPDEKIKMKNVCAISGKTKRILDSMIIYNYYLYLKTNCGKNERCYETEPGYYQCGKKITLQKIGDDCAVNEECYTGLCYYGKCSSINNDEDCTVENVPDNPEKVCNPGHWCFEDDSLNHLFKCVPFIGEGEFYDEIDGKKCRIGLAPYNRGTSFDICIKLGSLVKKEISLNPLLCQSGFSGCYKDEIEYEYTSDCVDKGGNKCFTIITDSSCEYNTDKGAYYCKPIVDGMEEYVVQILVECQNDYFDSVYYCPFTSGKENSFKSYISKLNSININDIYKDENKYNSVGLGNNDLSQALQKYYHYDELYSMGILNENGDINKNKKDEWEFYWRINSSFLVVISYYCYLLIIFLFF